MNTVNNRIICLLIVATLIILNTSCGDTLKPKWEYWVDNPLNTEIVIKIDDKEYIIPALTTQSIQIAQGKHTLTYNGSAVNFITKVNSNKSVTVINPTLSNYMLHGYFYISETAKNNDISVVYENNSYKYESGEGIVKLPVRILNTLFIDKAHTPWTYGLDEEAKSEINTSIPKTKFASHKLFREEQYMKEFAEELPTGIVFPVNSKKKLSEQSAYKFPSTTFLCDCDASNTFVKELEDRWNKMVADPSDIFQDVGSLYYDATIAQNKLNKECSKQFNPGREDKEYKEALKRLREELRYLSAASSIIIE